MSSSLQADRDHAMQSAAASCEKMDALEATATQLRGNLREEQLLRQDAINQVEELRQEMEKRTKDNIAALTDLERKNQLDVDRREALYVQKEQEFQASNEEQREQWHAQENQQLVTLKEQTQQLTQQAQTEKARASAWEERAIAAETAVEETTAQLSAARMLTR